MSPSMHGATNHNWPSPCLVFFILAQGVACVRYAYPLDAHGSGELLSLAVAEEDGVNALTLAAAAECYSSDGRSETGQAATEWHRRLGRLEKYADSGWERGDAARPEAALQMLGYLEKDIELWIAENQRHQSFMETCEPVHRQVVDFRARLAPFVVDVHRMASAWNAVESSWDRSALSDFVEVYPTSPFEQEVRQRLATMDDEDAFAARSWGRLWEAVDRGDEALHDFCDQDAGMATVPHSAQAKRVADEIRSICLKRNDEESLLASAESEVFTTGSERILDIMPALAQVARESSTPEMARRAEAERWRRVSAYAHCDVGEEVSSALAPNDSQGIYVVLLPHEHSVVEAGWIRSPTTLQTHRQCGTEDLGTFGLPEEQGEVWLVDFENRPAIAVVVPRPSEEEVALRAIEDSMDRSGTCNIAAYGNYASTDWIEAYPQVILDSSVLHVRWRLLRESDASQEAGWTSLMTTMLGAGRVRESTLMDKWLIEASSCAAWQLQQAVNQAESAGTTAPPNSLPERPAHQTMEVEGGSDPAPTLYEVLVDVPDPGIALSTIWPQVRSVRFDFELLLATVVIDEFGRRHAGEPKTLRHARMDVSTTRFSKNDWESISNLVDEANPLLEPSAARSTLRRYVDRWETW